MVEIPAGSRNKYEFDEEAGVIRLDRVLSSAVFYNFDYGFIEGTRADDGDPTDALLLIDEPTFPGCHVWARPVGGLRDARREGRRLQGPVRRAGRPAPGARQAARPGPGRSGCVEIEHFFQTYKLLEDKTVDVDGWADVDEALEVLRDDRKRWLSEIEAARPPPRQATSRRLPTTMAGSRSSSRSPAARSRSPTRTRSTSPRRGYTKLDLVRYYLAVADGALRGAGGRPMALKRFVNGADGEFFFQKRAPESRPDWIETVELSFPSGRTADEIVLRDAAQLAWIVNLGCIDLNPHPVRAEDLDHPDELRVDLDPVPGVPWDAVRRVALVTKGVLEDVGLVGWPKTSGSRGIHINVRIEPRWTFDEVRRAALALARDVERRAPDLATSKWWKEERHGVFLDYNQNAKDRTVASAYSVRPTPDARVSMPLRWEEVPTSRRPTSRWPRCPAMYAARRRRRRGHR